MLYNKIQIKFYIKNQIKLKQIKYVRQKIQPTKTFVIESFKSVVVRSFDRPSVVVVEIEIEIEKINVKK